MLFHFIHLFRFQTQQPLLSEGKLDSHQDPNADRYLKEHDRLEAIISDSENIWEERTYQIAVGGLSLTFAIYTFLYGNGVRFDWQMMLIWSLYLISLLLNYVSHRISIHDARKMQGYIKLRKDNRLPYIEEDLNKEYVKQGRLTTTINWIVGISLVVAVIYSIVYIFIILSLQ